MGAVIPSKTEGLRIRKLTPLECVKLMGFEEKDYLAMREAGMSDSAIYHMCGDSIVVSVIMSIFSTMIKGYERNQITKDYVDNLVKGNIGENGEKNL